MTPSTRYDISTADIAAWLADNAETSNGYYHIDGRWYMPEWAARIAIDKIRDSRETLESGRVSAKRVLAGVGIAVLVALGVWGVVRQPDNPHDATEEQVRGDGQ